MGEFLSSPRLQLIFLKSLSKKEQFFELKLRRYSIISLSLSADSKSNPFSFALTNLVNGDGASYGSYYSLPALGDERIGSLTTQIEIMLWLQFTTHNQ